MRRHAVPRTGPVVAKAALHDGRARVQPPLAKSDWRVEVRVGDSPALPFAGDLTERQAIKLAHAVELAAPENPPADALEPCDGPDAIDQADDIRGWEAIGTGVITIGFAAGWNAAWIALAVEGWRDGAGVGLALSLVPFALVGLVGLVLAIAGVFCVRDAVRDLWRGDAGDGGG